MILKNVITKRLEYHLNTPRLQDTHQSVYRTRQSTETALLKVHQDITEALDNNDNKHLYSARSSKPFSGALHDKSIEEHKFHLINSRFKQMCLKTFLKASIDLHSLIDPGRAFHSLEKLLTGWTLWGTVFER